MEEGQLIATGRCGLCGNLFNFDPDTVPSIFLDPGTGLPPDIGGTPADQAQKEPVCPPCVAEFNRQRRAAGLPVIWKDPQL